MRFLRSLRSVEIRGRGGQRKTYKLLLIGLSFYYLFYLFLGFSIAAWAAASFAIGTLYGEHDT